MRRKSSYADLRLSAEVQGDPASAPPPLRDPRKYCRWDRRDTYLFFIERAVSAMRRGLEQCRRGVQSSKIAGAGLVEEPAGLSLPLAAWENMAQDVRSLAERHGLRVECGRRYSDPPGNTYVKFSRKE